MPRPPCRTSPPYSASAAAAFTPRSARSVVVTGASRGIGLAIACAFAQEGANVVAGARTPGTGLAELADSHSLVPVAGDLATVEGVDRLIAAAATASAASTSW